MSIHKTAELEGVFLHAAVADVYDLQWQVVGPISKGRRAYGCETTRCEAKEVCGTTWIEYNPEQWRAAGAIMEREGISVNMIERSQLAPRKIGEIKASGFSEDLPPTTWEARMTTPEGREVKARGASAAVAVLRCVVAAKFGEQVTL